MSISTSQVKVTETILNGKSDSNPNYDNKFGKNLEAFYN